MTRSLTSPRSTPTTTTSTSPSTAASGTIPASSQSRSGAQNSSTATKTSQTPDSTGSSEKSDDPLPTSTNTHPGDPRVCREDQRHHRPRRSRTGAGSPVRRPLRSGLHERGARVPRLRAAPPRRGDTRYFVYTRWEHDAAFQAWRTVGAAAAHCDRDSDSDSDRPQVGTGADLLEFETVPLGTASDTASGTASEEGTATA